MGTSKSLKFKGDTCYSFFQTLQRNKTYSIGEIAYTALLPIARLKCTTAGTTSNSNGSTVSNGN